MPRNVPSSHTKCELQMAEMLQHWGYDGFITPPISRIIIKGREWPVEPDILFPLKKVCIFVHGRYWHMESKNKSRKLRKKKDAAKEELLILNGYIVLTFWDDDVELAWRHMMKKKFLKKDKEEKARATYTSIKYVVGCALKGK